MLACLFWLADGRTRADEPKPSTVLVVRVAGDETIVVRLRAELSGYRFRVVELPTAAKSGDDLSELADAREAQAALRAKPEAMAVEVWVRANGAGARTSQELVSAGPGRDPEVLAVRVTEAMRARGLALPPLRAAAAVSGKRGAPDGTAAAEPEDVDVAEPTPPVATTPIIPPVKTEPADAPATPARTTPTAPEPKPATPEPKPATPEPKPATPEPKPATPEPKSATPEPKADKATREDKKREDKKPEDEQREDKKREDEQREEPSPSEPEPEPEPETPTVPTESRPALAYVELGPTGVWSPGRNHIGPALHAQLSLRFRPYQTSSVSLVGLIPLVSTDLKTGEGAAIEVQTFGIGGFGDLHVPLGSVELNAGIGALALLSSVMVTPSTSPGAPVYGSDYPTQALAALLGRLGASLTLTRDLRASASLMIGLTVHELSIQTPRIASSQGDTISESMTIATWGHPLLLGTLGIELALPWDR